jgi:heme-degrading monooxygenase HmoA
MPFVSVTRLRLKSLRFLIPFAIHAARSKKQAETSSGCFGAEVRKTQGLTFWTLTVWDSEASMRSYIVQSPHREAMSKLAGWCDEASVAHWTQESKDKPTWEQATEHLAKSGRLSRVLHPSDAHRDGRINVS